MAKKKTKNQPKKKQVNAENVIGLHSEVTDQPITQTLEVNYMPYAMSVNVSRAFPEIDGFKPSHRKLLYTMYKMGLLKGERQKSANIVGQTMKLNPHGDAAIAQPGDGRIDEGRRQRPVRDQEIGGAATTGEAVGEDVVRGVIRMTRGFVDGYYFSIPFNRVYMLKEILPEI